MRRVQKCTTSRPVRFSSGSLYFGKRGEKPGKGTKTIACCCATGLIFSRAYAHTHPIVNLAAGKERGRGFPCYQAALSTRAARFRPEGCPSLHLLGRGVQCASEFL